MMYNTDKNLEEEQIYLEIKNLIEDIDGYKERCDVYCELIKRMFLSGSGKN